MTNRVSDLNIIQQKQSAEIEPKEDPEVIVLKDPVDQPPEDVVRKVLGEAEEVKSHKPS